jgi:hypothetical protein
MDLSVGSLHSHEAVFTEIRNCLRDGLTAHAANEVKTIIEALPSEAIFEVCNFLRGLPCILQAAAITDDESVEGVATAEEAATAVLAGTAIGAGSGSGSGTPASASVLPLTDAQIDAVRGLRIIHTAVTYAVIGVGIMARHSGIENWALFQILTDRVIFETRIAWDVYRAPPAAADAKASTASCVFDQSVEFHEAVLRRRSAKSPGMAAVNA